MMKRKTLMSDTSGSVYPAVIFIFGLAFAAFFILIINEFYVPLHQIMSSSDTDIDPLFDAPRRAGNLFIELVWPRGAMLVIFFVLSMALFMEYQKSKYKVG